MTFNGMHLDIRIFLWLNSFARQSKAGDFVITFLGSYLAYGIVLSFSIFLFIPPLSHDSLTILVTVATASIISRFAVGTPLRQIFHRTRPYIVHKVPYVFSVESFSFPSAHSLFFYAFSTTIFWFDHFLGGIFLAATAIMTLFRVISGVHYLSDILAGACIGIPASFFVYKFITPLLHSFLA